MKQEIFLPDGSKIFVDCEQFTMNDKQNFVCIAIPDELRGIGFQPLEHPGFKYDVIGHMQDQNYIFMQQIFNSLESVDWDFDNCPDPLIIIISIIQQ